MALMMSPACAKIPADNITFGASLAAAPVNAEDNDTFVVTTTGDALGTPTEVYKFNIESGTWIPIDLDTDVDSINLSLTGTSLQVSVTEDGNTVMDSVDLSAFVDTDVSGVTTSLVGGQLVVSVTEDGNTVSSTPLTLPLAIPYITCDGTPATVTDRLAVAPTASYAAGLLINQTSPNGCLTRTDLYYNYGSRSLTGGTIFAANVNSAFNSFLGFGSVNEITSAGANAAIVAGTGNEVGGGRGFIGAGQNNVIGAGANSGIVVGSNNSLAGSRNFIGGGSNNEITSGSDVSILGGTLNVNSGGSYNALMGYRNRVTSSSYNFVAGYNNTLNSYGGFAAGYSNQINGGQGFAFGNGNNIQSGILNALFGSGNTVNGNRNIVSGASNSIVGTAARDNALLGYSHTISSTGNYNLLTGYDQTLVLGNNNSLIGAGNRNVSGDNNSLIGNSNTNTGNLNTLLGYSHIVSTTGATAVGYNCEITRNFGMTFGRNLVNNVQDGIMIANSFQRLGFFGVQPVVRPTVAANASRATIIAALKTLGLFV